MGTLSDHDLVAAVRRMDDRAFEELFARYGRRITAYIYGMVSDHGMAEDITQDVFISALRRMRQTERPIAFKPWIYEIAKNACIDQFRRSRRADGEVSFDAEDALGSVEMRLADRGPSPDVAVDTKQSLDHLRGAFGGLSETHHKVLVLREFEGLSYREIGERMGLTRPAVESTLFRARRRLSEEYEELVSGERCVRIQGILECAGESGLRARERARVSLHLAHCQSCRRHARVLGVDDLVIGERVRRAAALLPFPVFLRRRGGAPADGPAFGGWQAYAPMLDGASGWAKAAIAAATVAIAGVGAGVATNSDGGGLRDSIRSIPAATGDGAAPAAGVTPRGGRPNPVEGMLLVPGSRSGRSGAESNGGAGGDGGSGGSSATDDLGAGIGPGAEPQVEYVHKEVTHTSNTVARMQDSANQTTQPFRGKAEDVQRDPGAVVGEAQNTAGRLGDALPDAP